MLHVAAMVRVGRARLQIVARRYRCRPLTRRGCALIAPRDLAAALIPDRVAPGGDLSQTRLQEPTLGGLARQLERALVGGPRRSARPSLRCMSARAAWARW